MFKLVKTTQVEEYSGQALLYRDDVTGMEAFHVKNNSSELSCAFIFATPSENSRGTAHILEHTVLCGSGHYPVKDPFSQIYLSSTNTFLNAMTFCDKTMYPFSSPLKKDFDNIFDVYADAVFNPLLRKESFEQEGIRSFGNFDGVVFNEMKGALSTEDSVVESYCAKALFKGTPMEFESGGDPEFIPDLTYEEYLALYRKWYSPANCRLFLFGDLDATEYLKKLEERYFHDLSKWDNRKITVETKSYIEGTTGPVRDMAYTSAQNANSIVLTWLTARSDDVDEAFTVSVLVDILLGSQSSPLYRAITQSGLGDDLSPASGINAESPLIPFTVGFTGAAKDSEDRVESFILDTLKGFVENGLDEKAVKTSMKRQEFRTQEIIGDSFPFGLGVCLKAARTWMRGSDPADGIQECAKLKRLKQRLNNPHYFEDWIQKNLLDNPVRCLLTVKTDSDYQKKLESLFEEKYRRLHSDSSVDWKSLEESFNSFVNSADSLEKLALIPRLTRNDLPAYKNSFETVQIRKEPYRLYTLSQITRGIVYVQAAFNTVGLELEEKKLLPVLVRVLQMCGTEKKGWIEFCTSLRFLTGSFSIAFDSSRGYLKDPVSNIIIKTKMLEEDVEPALELIAELLVSPCFKQERIKAAITDIITDFESSFIDSGSSYASLHASSFLTASALESELFVGVSSYLYVKELKEKCKDDCGAISDSLYNLAKKIFTEKGLSIHLSCESSSMDKNLVLSGKFAEKLPAGKDVSVSDFYRNFKPENSVKKALLVSGAPAYNAMAVPMKNSEPEVMADCSLLGHIMGNGYLWNSVRGQFGAYGAECHMENQERLFLFSSYRDPMIENTYEEFEKCLSAGFSNLEKDYSIISIIGKELKPYAPWGKSIENFRRILFGISDELYLKRRNRILTVSVEQLQQSARKILESLEKGSCKVTVCGLEMKDKLPSGFITQDLGL